MKSYLVTAALLVIVGLATLNPRGTVAQTTGSTAVGLKSTLYFFPPTTDIVGNAEAAAIAEVVLASPDSAVSSDKLVLNVPAEKSTRVALSGTAEVSYALSGFFSDAAQGKHRLWLRCLDAAGNPGQYAGPLNIELDTVGPGAPTGLKIVVTAVTQ